MRFPMNRSTALFVLILLCSLELSAQTLTVSNLSNRMVQFDLTNTNVSNTQQQAPPFYFFGDGHFSIREDPLHEFHSAGTFDTEVYTAVYNPTLPTLFTTQTIGLNQATGSGSSTALQSVGSQSVEVGQSWAAVAGQKMIYIVSFTYPFPVNHGPINGTIELELDSKVTFQQVLNPPQASKTYNDWADLGSPSGGTPGQPPRVDWHFDNLMDGEVRHLYVEVFVNGNAANQSLFTNITMTGDDPSSASGRFIRNNVQSTVVASTPRDPNNLVVDHEIVLAGTGGQVLEYTVNFQNDGFWYAEDIEIVVDLDDEETEGGLSVQLLDSTAPCYLSSQMDGEVIIRFEDIFLPGSNQAWPTFTYDQTTGSVKFSLCTKPQLDPGSHIDASATIFFDSQPGVQTNTAETLAEYGVPPAPFCFDEDEDLVDGLVVDDTMEEGVTAPGAKAFPNPFTNRISTQYDVQNHDGAQVEIRLHSLSGQIQQVLFSGFQPRGSYLESFDLSQLAPGAYLLEIWDGTQRITKRIVKMDR